MVSQKVTVSNPTGIHARPAATLAKTAAPFKSSIILVAGEKRLQAKSVLNLMSAAIKCGTEITVECDGEDEAEALKVPKVGDGRTGECVEGIRRACELITDRPVLAGIIGPYSLAGRLLDMTEIMILCYEEPEMVESVLEKATEFLIEYAKAFKEAGANGVCMAEPAAGLLSPNLIDEFSTPYVQKIREAVEDENFVVMYHNCGNITPLMQNISDIDAVAYSVGNAIDIEEALKVIPADKMIIGNIDPAGTIRNGNPETVYKETTDLLERCGKYPNFVIASGCDIPPVSPMENIEAFFDAVRDFYNK